MSTSHQLIKNNSSKKIKKELTFLQKCIILANITKDKKKKLINSFDNIPMVKFYTAQLSQDNFVYSKIKGALCFFYEEVDKKKNYFLQIYDVKNFTLAFSLQMNQKFVKAIIKMDEKNFFCIPSKFIIFGFKFNSKDSMEKFLKILTCEKEPDKNTLDMNLKSYDINCDNKEASKIIKEIKTNFDKNNKLFGKESGVKVENEKNIFAKFEDIYNLVNCIEYDEINKKFNIFVEKTYNTNIIKKYIDKYKNSKDKNSLNIQIIFNDYTHIFSKNAYVDILINNLMNNFSEIRRLTTFRREHLKRYKKKTGEAKRGNSDYNINVTTSSSNCDKRNSAIIPQPKFNTNNDLKRTNAVIDKSKNISYLSRKSSTLSSNVKILEEVPEEDVDHLKKFDDEKKTKKTKK